MGELHVARSGAGPDIMLLAGTGGRVDFWSGVRPLLETDFAVTAFDYRNSPAWDDSTPFESFARKTHDALTLMEDRQTLLVAHSSGCHVAAQIAAENPDKISGLVLSGGWPGPSPYVTECFALRKRILEEMGPADFLADGLFRSMPTALLAKKLEANGMESLTGFREAVDVTLESARIDMIMTADSRGYLPKIGAPTLVLCAKDDTVFPPSLASQLADDIQGARLKLIETGGHLAPMTNPDAWSKAVSTFLREITDV